MTASQPPASEFGPAYLALLDAVKAEIRAAQARVRSTATEELVMLYWRIGRRILDRQEAEGWGARVVDRLAADLKAALPNSHGLSARNLQYMRAFAATHPDPAITQQAVARLPWGHVTVLLDRLGGAADLQRWYALEAVQHGWSRAVLLNMVRGGLHDRQGVAPSNFAGTLPPPDSELAQQATRDPYLLDFLAVREPLLERDLEDALTADLQRFLLELGTGFAFCGRQVPIRVEGREYALDLLFFNWRLNRFVAVELMVTEFDPGHAGRLGFYVTWIDDNLRLDHHNPTLGILVCATKTNSVVRYTLDSLRTPMAVAAFTTLPAELQAALPPAEALQELVAETLRHESPGGEVPR